MDGRLGYSIREAATVTGVGRTMIYQWIGAGLLRAWKAGRRTIITAEDLRGCLSGLPSIEVKAAGAHDPQQAHSRRGRG
jgi:excisionase family DNA binding protein